MAKGGCFELALNCSSHLFSDKGLAQEIERHKVLFRRKEDK
jgi:hypothetical protein